MQKFPSDWKVNKMLSLGTTYSGLTNKNKKDFDGGNQRYIPYKNIYSHSFVNPDELEFVQISEDERQNAVIKGDVLFTGSSETPNEVGMSSVVLDDLKDVYLNSFCFGFRFNDLKNIFPKFYGYYFRSDDFRKKVYPLAQGSTRFNLAKSQFVKLEVPIPSKEEQLKISTILSSVDAAIKKTEDIINQTEVLNQGVIHQLMTQGMGQSKFKQTKIGRIPEAWQILKLGEVFKLTSGKSKTKKHLHEFSTDYPVPVYGGNGVNGFTDEILIDLPTIIIGRVGEYCGVVHLSKEKSWVTDNALYTKTFLCDCDLEFLYYMLTYHNLRKLRSQSGQPLISQKPIYEYLVAFPRLEEQQAIVRVLRSVADKKKKERKTLDFLKQLKKGIMQMLLTGERRVCH